MKHIVLFLLWLGCVSCAAETEVPAVPSAQLSPADKLDTEVCDLFRTAKPVPASPLAGTTDTLTVLVPGKLYAIESTSPSGGYLSFASSVHSHYLAYAAEPIAQLLISIFTLDGVNIPAEFITATVPKCDQVKQRALIEIPKGEYKLRFKSEAGNVTNVVLIDGGEAYNHSEGDSHVTK